MPMTIADERMYYARGPQTLSWKRGPREGLSTHCRSAAFWDWTTGRIAGEGGGTLCISPHAPLAQALDRLSCLSVVSRPRTIFLTGPDRATHRPPAAWYEDALGSGWHIDEWFHSEEHRDRHACDLSRIEHRYTLRMAEEWFGPERDEQVCASSWRALRATLRKHFGEHAYVYPNPTQTGIYLMQIKLPFNQEYRVLPDGLRQMIHGNAPQGRVEMLTPRGLREIPRILCLDARWMYASCCHHLPVGPWHYDGLEEYAEHVPGFYRVIVKIPAEWKHIGLAPELYNGRTRYPTTPGYTFSTWITGAEFELAREHSWIRKIQRRLLWHETESSPDPARPAVRIWRELRAEAEAHGQKPLSAAYRNLLIHAIGAWHSRGTIREGFTPLVQDDQIPAGVHPHLRPGGWAWTQRIDQIHPWSHPEWSATVWGRARARLARAALELPRESLIALRTDGIWTTQDPGWPDTQKPGAWRIKDRAEEPLAAPRDEAALLAIMREIRSRDEEG